MGVPLRDGPKEVPGVGARGVGLMLRALQLNEAHDQYGKLEERMEYIRSLHELIRNHFSLFSAEAEALDILVRREFSKSPIPPGPPAPGNH